MDKARTGKLNDVIASIRIINLDRCVDKRIKTLGEVKKLPEYLRRKTKIFSAIDGTKLSSYHIQYTPDPNWYDPKSGKRLTQGEIGCSLSHWLLWQEASLMQNDAYMLILEDDIEFQSSFIDEFETYIPYLTSKRPDLFYLGRSAHWINDEEMLQDNPRVNQAKYSHHTHAYMISKQGADKLLNGRLIDAIIPVDEYLPIMYGSTPNVSHRNNYKYGTLNAAAAYPMMIELRPDAFLSSETCSSQPHIFSSNTLEDNLEILGIGSEETCGRIRFKRFCEIYGVHYSIIGDGVTWKMDMSQGPGGGQKILILRDHLSKIRNIGMETKIILVTDTYDVLVLANSKMILDRYGEYVKDHGENVIVFSAERCCWPDESLKKRYPKVDKYVPRYLNSGGFIGRACDVWNLIRECEISEWDDDQLFWTQKFLDNEGNIQLDYSSSIFQCLNRVNKYLKLNYYSRIKNTLSGLRPCLLHGNGPLSVKIELNALENYLGNNWHQHYGYVDAHLYTTSVANKKIYLALVGNNAASLSYPSELTITKNYEKLDDNVLADFLKTDAEYYVSWECNESIIDVKDVIQKLIPKTSKGVIAPFLRYDGDDEDDRYYSNFWGAIDEEGGYERSHDYLDIVDQNRKGLWNVPYVTSFLIISRWIIVKYPSLYEYEESPDTSICARLRDRGVFMYVDNMEQYGRMIR